MYRFQVCNYGLFYGEIYMQNTIRCLVVNEIIMGIFLEL